MAITFVGSNTATNIAGTAITLSLPAANQNDLVIVVTGCQNETKGGPPSTAGYTAIADVLHTSDCRLHVSYKFMGSTPDPSVSIPATGVGTIGLVALALVFRGVSTATPLDVAASIKNDGAGIPRASPITAINNDCCIVIAAAAANVDTAVGGASGYLPSPSVQQSADTVLSGDVTAAAAYQIFSGVVGLVSPTVWSSWTTGDYCAVTIALRPQTVSTDFNTVDHGMVTTIGKAVAERETIAVSKATVGYLGKTIGIPDSSVEAIFVDKYRMVITGQEVNPFDTSRAVTVTPAAVLYRGRIVTPREIVFEDVPRYRVKGRGSGHWMETR